MELYKLSDNQIYKLPRPLNGLRNGIPTSNLDLVYRDNMAVANENGWYELVETPQPQTDGYYYSDHYSMVGNKIVQSWTAQKIETEEV